MQPLIYDLLPELKAAGDSAEQSAHLDIEAYELGDKVFALPEGIDYNIILSHTGEGILVSGVLKTVLSTECDRCLDPARLEISSEIEGYYLFEEPEEVSEDDEEYELVVDDTIDLAPALESALVLEIPFVVLCKDDCEGLCPQCGCNLNRESCSCADVPDPTHPFAQLAALKGALLSEEEK